MMRLFVKLSLTVFFVFTLVGCAAIRQREAERRQMDDDYIYSKFISYGVLDDCARDFANGVVVHKTDLCNKYKYRPEMQSKIKQIKLTLSEMSEKQRQQVQNRTLAIGMTSDQVRLICGKPSRINNTTTKNVTSYQWVYDGVPPTPTSYVYFKDGLVSGWQNF